MSLDIYDSNGQLATPCPRCRANANVEVKSLSRKVHLGILAGMVSAMAAQWIIPSYDVIGQAVVLALAVFQILAGQKASCTACGATLQKEVGSGWR